MALPARPSFSPQSSERLLHSGMTVGRYFGMHFLGALFPLTAGLMLYGWRAAAVVGAVVLSALAAAGLWRNIGPRGRQIHFAHVLWLALLLAMMLPAHLATAVPLVRRDAAWPPWPLLIAAGVTLVTVLWLLGGSGAIYVHPVLVTYLLLFIGFRQDLTPNWVLGRDHLVAGDVLLAPGEIPANVSPDPWLRRAAEPKHNALRADPPALWLTDYTTGRLRPERGQMPLHELLRDRMPPLEDLIVGGQPAPIGVGSGIAVIIGGLFLLYRGLIDFRIPLLAPLFAFVALLVLPVPTVVRDTGTPLAVARPARAGRAVGHGGDVRELRNDGGPAAVRVVLPRDVPQPPPPEPPVAGDLRRDARRPLGGRTTLHRGLDRAVRRPNADEPVLPPAGPMLQAQAIGLTRGTGCRVSGPLQRQRLSGRKSEARSTKPETTLKRKRGNVEMGLGVFGAHARFDISALGLRYCFGFRASDFVLADTKKRVG